MLIDIVSSAATAAVPAEEPAAAATEAPSDGPGSFAALLGKAAKESDEPKPVDEDDKDDASVDGWAAVPVVVPFMGPIVPQEIPAPEASVDASSIVPAGDDSLPVDFAVDATAPVDTGAVASPDLGPVDVTAAQGEPAVVATPDAAARTDASAAAPAPEAAKTIAASAGETTAQEISATTDVQSASEPATAETAVPKDPAATESPVRTEQGTRSSAHAHTSAHAHKSTHAVAVQGQPADEKPAGAAPVTEAVASGAPRETRVTGTPSGESEAGAKGIAARLARALERATENVATPGSDATADMSQDSSSGNNGQPSLGQWLKEQLLPQTPAAHQAGSAAPAFTVTAPPQVDARLNALLAAAGSPLTGSAPVMPNEHDVAAQLVQSLKLQFRDGIGEAVLRLKPEHLGSVSISIRVENGGIKANVQAEVAAVRQWLESQQDTLRTGLAEQGLRLDRFEVDPEGERQRPSSDAREEQSARRRQRQQRRASEAEQPVFEVVV